MVIGCTSDFHFESRKTSLEIAFDFTLQVFQSFSRCIETCAGITLYLICHLPQQLAYRQSCHLAKQIPKCNINAADGAHHHTFATVGPVIPYHFLMQILDFCRILSKNQWF